jgi:hypothetical protein
VTAAELARDLPGEEILLDGLPDFFAGRVTVASCLICIGLPRLQRAGAIPAEARSFITEPESTLYALLRQEGGNAYARYNAWIRRLISLEQALEQRRARKRAWT